MTSFTPLMSAYLTFVVAILGLCMGSFLNCLAWRMTHGESVLHGRSHCTSCGHVLGARDLVPVFSWLATRGSCRYCGEHVSARYPATELLCAAMYVSILWAYGLTLEAIELIAFASVLLVLSLTDLDEYVIPNPTIVCAIGIRALYIVCYGALGMGDAMVLLRDSVIGGVAVVVPIVVLALIMDRVLGRDSLGGGDVKLFFVAGLYFGWQQCLFLIMLSCVLGIVMGMVGQKLGRGGDGEDARLIPFGPAIALACWVCMLVGEQAVSWYLSLF